MKQIGSQYRETLKESGYGFLYRSGKGVVILMSPEGKPEMWIANDGYAGYTIQIGRWGYEFVSEVA